jgi:hypothetical protein
MFYFAPFAVHGVRFSAWFILSTFHDFYFFFGEAVKLVNQGENEL